MVSNEQGAFAGRGKLVRGRSTWALYFLLALFAYLETTVGPAMPFIRSELKLSYTVTSLHFSAFALGGIVAGLAGDRVVLRIGRTSALWGGMAGMALGVALLAVSPLVAGTLAGAFLAGLAGTIALMANQSALSDLHGNARSVAIAESNVAASSAAVIAPLAIGGLDRASLGWQSALLLGLPLLVLAWFRFGTTVLPAARAHMTTRSTSDLLPRLFWLYWTILFLLSAVEWCVAYWGADFLSSVVGLTESWAATAMSIFFGAMVAGRIAGARLTRRHPGGRLIIVALGFTLVGFPVFWLAPDPVLNLIGLFVAGIGIANFYPLALGAATDAAASMPDRATARLAIAGGSSLLIGPLIIGSISDLVGMRWGFGLVVPLLVGAAAVTLVAQRETSTTLGSFERDRAPA
jgi:MFS family permease